MPIAVVRIGQLHVRDLAALRRRATPEPSGADLRTADVVDLAHEIAREIEALRERIELEIVTQLLRDVVQPRRVRLVLVVLLPEAGRLYVRRRIAERVARRALDRHAVRTRRRSESVVVECALLWPADSRRHHLQPLAAAIEPQRVIVNDAEHRTRLRTPRLAAVIIVEMPLDRAVCLDERVEQPGRRI